MLEWIQNTLQTLGYPGIAFLTFLENVVPPIPSELIIPASGYAAARGDLTLWGVILATTVGGVWGSAAVLPGLLSGSGATGGVV